MNKIRKFIAKLEEGRRKRVTHALWCLEIWDIDGLDITKLKGADSLYRVRLGKVRIIFEKQDFGVKIISVSNKDDTTYNL